MDSQRGSRPGTPLQGNTVLAVHSPVVFDDTDAYLFREGTHARLFDKLGCHPHEDGGADFAVWAPNAESVSVVGDWNGWNGDADPLSPVPGDSGVWRGHAEDVRPGQTYKYRIRSRLRGHVEDKADPFAFSSELALSLIHI